MADSRAGGIGARLKEAREKAGLTQKQAGEAIGVSHPQISYWETGSRMVDLATLGKLSDLYGYSVAWFLAFEPEVGHSISISFRAGQLNEADLKVLAWARRFARNLDLLMEIREAESDERSR